MQNSDKNIDRLFRDKLFDHKVVPPPTVWNNITSSLDGGKRKRRMIFIWGISSAASLLLAFLAGWYLSGELSPRTTLQAENSTLPVKITPSESVPQVASNALPFAQKEQQPEQYQTVTDSKNSPAFFNSRMVTQNEQPETRHENFLLRLLTPLKTKVEGKHESHYELIAMNRTDEFSDADRAIIAQNLSKKDAMKKENDQQGFSLGIQGSPVYRFDGGSGSSRDFNSSGISGSQSYRPNVSGGVAVTYKATKRLSVQSGVGLDRVAQDGGEIGVTFAGHNWLTENNDNFVYTGNSTDPQNSSNNVIIETTMGLTNIVMPEGVSLASANTTNKLANEATKNYELTQKASYIEIPLIVRYRIIDRRLGFYMLGGVNTNVLVDNQASLSTHKAVIANGRIEGLNPLTFSSSMGVGLNYSISERFNLSLEPTMKLQLSSLNSQSYANSRPYSVGIFTGLTYNF